MLIKNGRHLPSHCYEPILTMLVNSERRHLQGMYASMAQESHSSTINSIDSYLKFKPGTADSVVNNRNRFLSQSIQHEMNLQPAQMRVSSSFGPSFPNTTSE